MSPATGCCFPVYEAPMSLYLLLLLFLLFLGVCSYVLMYPNLRCSCCANPDP